LNLTGLIIGIFSFTSFPESTYGYFLKFISFLKSFLISIKKPERADVVSEGKNNAVNKDVNTGMKVYRHSGKKSDLKNIPADGPVMNITIPKIIFLILGIVLFLVVQLFLVKQNYRAVVFLLFADVLLLVSFFLIKGDALRFKITFENAKKMAIMSFGIFMVLAGWVLLKNRANMIQNIGVIITTIGIFLAFYGLPENRLALEPKNDDSEILFAGHKIFDNYIVKLSLILLTFVFVFTGNRLIVDERISMFSMFFYALGIGTFFLAMPVINFNIVKHDNTALNAVRLAAIIGAIIIAFFGQKLFLENKIGDAITRYFIAGIIFIVFSPISLKKDETEPVPLKFEYVFLLAITLIGLFLRVYELDKRPFGLENDESAAMISVVKNFWVGQHPIYAHLWELCYSIFGLNRIGLRASGVIIGTLTIPAVYFLVRSVLNARSAMFAAVLFSFLRWNLHYGRSGHGTILAIFATLLAVYFIFKSIEKRDKFTYFMAGMMSGLCWYGVLTGWFVVLAPLLYMFFESFTKKEYLKRNFIGILAFLIGFWVFGSHHIKNYFISTNTYFARINEVSVFSGGPNAPVKNPAIGIVENTQRVLLMFNHQGDSRQRNSGGMPYEPTVDFVTAMLFGVGFLYCIYYSKYYVFFILVMIFFSQAAGSIFAIEAPSAMRAIGTMIPVILFVSIAFDILLRALNGVFKGKLFRRIVFPVLLLIVLFPIVKENYRQYFQRWVGGMDELATATGMYSQQLGKSYRINLYTSLYYPGHPPFRMFRWDYKVDASKEPLDNDVKLTLIDDENYAIFFHYDVWHTENIWKEMYPDAKFETVEHTGFGKMFDVLLISNEEIKKMRGLKGVIGGTPAANAVPGAEGIKPAPYTISLEGKVMVPYYCEAVFGNTGNARISYTVDGIALKEKESIRLAKGMHNIRVNVSVRSAADTIFPVIYLSRYAGKTKTSTEMFPLNEKYLYTIKNNGLRAVYYGGDRWSGLPVEFEEITPVPFYIRGGQSNAVKLSGYFNTDVSAKYKFNVTNNGFAAVIIDGTKYWDNVAGNKVNPEIFRPGLVKNDSFNLGQGKHKIEIYTLNSSQFSMKVSVNGAEARSFGFGELEPDYSRISYNQ
ncbi:MAG TPA: glycosyltransferase family 39 protein, partial [Candidatus Goldiibacteriota bacterium]|nr:glycosyltransferase family 39 protein [Candidatus Goldiibacteriota bacterium]